MLQYILFLQNMKRIYVYMFGGTVPGNSEVRNK